MSKIRNPKKVFSQGIAGSVANSVTILSNNVYKIAYYEIISGTSGTLTLPTGATINSGEFGGSNCVLSEIDGSNKPTFVTPLTAGGAVVTSTLNASTGAWVKSGVTLSSNVALIYSVNVNALNYVNLNNFYIIDSAMINGGYVPYTGANRDVSLGTFSLTTPLIIGGSGVGSVIQYQGTSANGTSTVAAHQFLVGNNGATISAKAYNDGSWNFGNATANATAFGIVRIGQGTSMVDVGEVSTGVAGIWLNQTPTSTNYSLAANAGGTTITLNSSSTLILARGASARVSISAFSTIFNTGQASASATTPYTFTLPSNLTQTTATAIPQYLVTMGNTQWAQGNISATQPFFSITQPTISFATSSSTATLTATLSIAGAPNSGTNAVQTTAVGLLVQSAAVNGTGTVGTSYGALINAQTGATTNYAAGFSGNVNILNSGTLTLNSAVLTGGDTGTVAIKSNVYFQEYLSISNSSVFSPADATTYYGGMFVSNNSSFAQGIRKIYIRKNCKLIGYTVAVYTNGTLGTAELSTLYVRVDNTTDVTLDSNLNLSNNLYASQSSALSTTINAGSYVEVKWITPTWSTNPTNVTVNVTLDFEGI